MVDMLRGERERNQQQKQKIQKPTTRTGSRIANKRVCVVEALTNEEGCSSLEVDKTLFAPADDDTVTDEVRLVVVGDTIPDVVVVSNDDSVTNWLETEFTLACTDEADKALGDTISVR